MKKLLIFREGVHPDSREVDDYLYDSELIRSDFIDMSPEEEFRHYAGSLSIYASTWEVVFKGDDKYDFWHLVCEGTHTYAFEEDSFNAAIGFFQGSLVGPGNCDIQAVIHKNDHMTVIYRLPKALSELVNAHLTYRLESYSEGKYGYEIPESATGPVLVSDAET